MGIKIYEFFKEYVLLVLFGTPFNIFLYYYVESLH
jgi:hypothetical protein